VCPFNEDHKNDAVVMQAADGKLSARCVHNSCSQNGWRQFRDAIGKPEGDHYDPPKPEKKKAKAVPVKREQGARPTVLVSCDEHETNKSAIVALSSHSDIYSQNGSLVHVLKIDEQLRIEQFGRATLRDHLSEMCYFIEEVENEEGDF
jgi:hypothetical protein